MSEVVSSEPRLVVGVGSSAGGLEAIRRFLSGVVVPSPHAYVVIQHLSPTHKSMMPELLSRSTKMPVVNVLDEAALVANSVYVVPSACRPTVHDGKVFAVAHDEVGPRHSITDFFEALASEWGPRAVAVVLSGSGSDGAVGIQPVHDAGGLVLVEGDTASFRGMPSAAMATKKAHASLDPESMPEIIDSFGLSGSIKAALEPVDPADREPDGALRDILKIIEGRYGVDFNVYKHKMVRRRIMRRMSLEQHANFDDYLLRITEDRDESALLYENLLIGVTSFFRDEDSWSAFKKLVVHPICETRNKTDQEIRVWVTGCSLGQEAYSVAQVFHEVFDELGINPHLRIFSTDVNESSIAIAAQGVYSADSVNSISARRLEEMFEPLPSGKFRIRDHLRNRVLFSRQNLFEDAPFSRMDVVTCRNMLICFGKSARDRAISAMHFALRMDGYLFLGPSESLGSVSDEYMYVDRKWNIFTKTSNRRPLMLFPFKPPNKGVVATSALKSSFGHSSKSSFESLVGRIAGDAVLIDTHGSVLHLFGEVSNYLRPAAGPMNTAITSMCKGELRILVGNAIKNAKLSRERVVMGGTAEDGEPVDVIVDPNLSSSGDILNILVRFAPPAHPRMMPQNLPGGDTSQHILALEHELLASRQALQVAVEELELTNEELQSSNEELHANLEELQSTNEELHSVNEELYSVNAEYEDKLTEVRKIRLDQENLIRVADVGVIFVTSSRSIRFFSPLAKRVFHLIDQDIGRDLAHITPQHVGANLIELIDEVLDDGEVRRQTIQLDDGSFMLARLKSFQTKDDSDRGVILTFSDVTELERLRRQDLERKAQIQRILDHVPNGIWHTTPGGQNEYVNKYLADFCGRSREDFRQSGWLEMIHPDDAQRSVEEWDSARATTTPYVSRFRMRHASGSYRWVESSGLPVRDESNELNGWYGSLIDIHDEHMSKVELEAFNQDLEVLVARRTREVELSEERLRLAGEYGTDGFWDWDLLTNEEYLSPRFKELFGYEDHEMENSPASWQAIIHPEDRVRAEEALRAHIEEGEPYNLTVRYSHKDGSTVWVICRGVAQQDEQGRWARMVGTHTDITELKRVELELHAQRTLDQSRGLVERVAERAPIMLWLANRRGEREYFNSTWTEFTGRSLDLELGDGWLAGVASESRARVKAVIGRAILAQQEYSIEYDLKRRDGSFAALSERAVPFLDEQGAFAGYIGTVLDMSEQRLLAEKQRVQLERATSTAHLESLGVLAGGIAHDFNNILTSIIAPASIAKEDVDPDSDVHDMLSEIEHAAYRAADLCRLLLDASGGATMTAEVVSLNDVVTDSVSLLPAARRKSARLEWRLDERSPHVEAESTQLRRMVMNVVLNALDALDGVPGDVCIETSIVDANQHPPTHLAPGFEPPDQGSFVVLAVSDTGQGISRETMRRIFEPFFSTKPTGRGLGLSATRGALRAAGGVLEVESVVGSGTSMRLWFPSADTEIDDVSEGEDLAAPDTYLGGATVLVVDDEPSVAGMVSRVLGRCGLDVHTVNSATEALELCATFESPPELAFIDYTMPDMFGDALSMRLREIFPDIGIILLSGYSVEHSDAALGLGTFDAFIAKPFDAAQIVSVARTHLAST